MNDAELRELLLPSDLVVPGEYTIPIAELTGVLQTDLVMPVTKSDQMVSHTTKTTHIIFMNNRSTIVLD